MTEIYVLNKNNLKKVIHPKNSLCNLIKRLDILLDPLKE